MKLQSTFALLDVMHGRVTLKKRIDKGERIPVVVHGFIYSVWGNDDGISREFEVDVKRVEIPAKSEV